MPEGDLPPRTIMYPTPRYTPRPPPLPPPPAPNLPRGEGTSDPLEGWGWGVGPGGNSIRIPPPGYVPPSRSLPPSAFGPPSQRLTGPPQLPGATEFGRDPLPAPDISAAPATYVPIGSPRSVLGAFSPYRRFRVPVSGSVNPVQTDSTSGSDTQSQTSSAPLDWGAIWDRMVASWNRGMRIANSPGGRALRGLTSAALRSWQLWNYYRQQRRSQQAWRNFYAQRNVARVRPVTPQRGPTHAPIPGSAGGIEVSQVVSDLTQGGGWGAFLGGIGDIAGQLFPRGLTQPWPGDMMYPGGPGPISMPGGLPVQPAFFDMPFGDIAPQGSMSGMGGACIAPTARGSIGFPTTVQFMAPTPSGNQRCHTYRNKGTALLYSDDLAACKRVKRAAARARKAVGGR